MRTESEESCPPKRRKKKKEKPSQRSGQDGELFYVMLNLIIVS